MAKIIYLCQLYEMCKEESPCLYQKWSERSYLVYLCQLGIFAAVSGCTNWPIFPYIGLLNYPFWFGFITPLEQWSHPSVLCCSSGVAGVEWGGMSKALSFFQSSLHMQNISLSSLTRPHLSHRLEFDTHRVRERKRGGKKKKKEAQHKKKPNKQDVIVQNIHLPSW